MIYATAHSTKTQERQLMPMPKYCKNPEKYSGFLVMRYTPVVTGLSSGADAEYKETPAMTGIIMPRMLKGRPT